MPYVCYLALLQTDVLILLDDTTFPSINIRYVDLLIPPFFKKQRFNLLDLIVFFFKMTDWPFCKLLLLPFKLKSDIFYLLQKTCMLYK